MNKENWIWMPHAGHFIMGSYCRFKLNTYLGNGYIVSTIGELWPDREIRKITAECRGIEIKGRGDNWDYDYMEKIGFEDIGYNRKYETMVFKANPNECAEAACCPYRPADWEELDVNGYNDAVEAYKGHMEMCEEWSNPREKHRSNTRKS